MATLITKNSSTASSVPTNAQLVQGELAVNVTDKRLYTENASGTVVELGTNPSTLALPNGTANGVAYLNGSKVLTTGSALTFDGTTFTSVGQINAKNDLLLSDSTATQGRAYGDASGVVWRAESGLVQRWHIGSSEQMRLTSTGLGIGTSSPSARLHVAGEQLIQPATAANAKLSMRHGSIGNNNYFEVDSSSNTIFGTANTERARITSGGDLLVGTTSTDGKISVSYSYPQTGISLVSNSTSTQSAISFSNPNGTVGSINTSGSSTSYNTSSDYRLKNTIAPMTGALAKVALLKPCTYKWNADGSDGEGFIAHELAEVVPQCVTGEKDAVNEDGTPKYQGIDTSFLVATLTAAIQELKAELDTVKAELNALKGN